VKDTVRLILGKHIKSVLINERDDSMLRQQMFLIFDDGTYFEFYGHISAGPALASGGAEGALKYAQKSEGRLQTFE
jgi:hypothetical protein